MKRFAIVTFATFGILLATVPAARAADTSCTGNMANVTINGTLVVPNGASCTLGSSTVTGNVQVGSAASLMIGDNVSIGGNIQADRCKIVTLTTLGGNIFVGGNIQIRHCRGAPSGYFPSSGGSITISGNFTCDNNLAPCQALEGSIGGNVQVKNNSGGGSVVNFNTITGNVQVSQNSGGSSDVSANNIGGNLSCSGNTGVTDVNGANMVTGNKQGQCAGL